MLSAVFATLVAATAIAVHAQSGVANCDREYTVQENDFCDKISAAQNVSTFQLAEVNKAVIDPLCDNLHEGEVICLGVEGQDCTTVHVIAEGEFCFEIAGNAGISLDTLLANNPNVNSDCSNIGVGEVLCTANVTIPYTPSTAA
ncbi:hypothetical protein EIP91_010094 [Steccherinum ochraceum]|uniref:LysM domain-containing protein n=1 Tax=Steccherinum ochraceum TaxID=92696 RepID=A0A4R0S1X9_9APHY|nr:hypothetical protein EIP91_010094 [Steccherinum ochraceum]